MNAFHLARPRGADAPAKLPVQRKKRFWRACSNAFLAIHLLALAIVGFMVGDGWLFRVVAASIVVGPVLAYLAHKPIPNSEAKEAAHG